MEKDEVNSTISRLQLLVKKRRTKAERKTILNCNVMEDFSHRCMKTNLKVTICTQCPKAVFQISFKKSEHCLF